jgi:hypothetical protein
VSMQVRTCILTITISIYTGVSTELRHHACVFMRMN